MSLRNPPKLEGTLPEDSESPPTHIDGSQRVLLEILNSTFLVKNRGSYTKIAYRRIFNLTNVFLKLRNNTNEID
jgi:hypothetical protein